jgi:hypothetical protein
MSVVLMLCFVSNSLQNNFTIDECYFDAVNCIEFLTK